MLFQEFSNLHAKKQQFLIFLRQIVKFYFGKCLFSVVIQFVNFARGGNILTLEIERFDFPYSLNREYEVESEIVLQCTFIP